jgi:hypothetical protein
MGNCDPRQARRPAAHNLRLAHKSLSDIHKSVRLRKYHPPKVIISSDILRGRGIHPGRVHLSDRQRLLATNP